MIPYGRQWIDDDDLNAVLEVLKSPFLTQGPKIGEFEDLLCQLTGARHAIAVSNGTVALYLACRVLGIKEGDIGITTPISFVASANCMVLNGATPEFVDISEKDLNIDPKKIEDRLKKSFSSRPKVIIPVDFAGIPANLPQIYDLSKKYGFFVIEDAAHAIGSRYKWGEKWYQCGSCSHSHLAIFSFHPVKTITTGEGGAVLTNDPHLAKKVRLLVNHGVERDFSNFMRKDKGKWYYEMQDISFNFRITDIQCALGISQLKRLSYFKERRLYIYKKYLNQLKGLEEQGIIRMTHFDENSIDPCPHLFVIRLMQKSPLSRDELFNKLLDYGIRTQVHYFPIHLQPFYMERFGFKEGMFPIAEEYAKNCLTLPLFPLMKDEEVEMVVDRLLRLLL